MIVAFTILVHATLLLAAVGQLVLIYFLIVRFYPVIHEQIMRALAATCGLLIYVGSKAVGVSIPDLVFKALSTSLPISVGVLGIVLPAACGLAVSWYVVRYLNSKDAVRDIVGMRLLALTMTFVFFLYCDSYVASYSSQTRNEFIYLL